MIMVLQKFFKTIIIAIDGEDGFTKFQENQIDIIITDINMPKLNGIEMIEKIRTINQDVSIVVLSAHDDTKYLTESIKYQVQGYLFKPVDRKHFSETVGSICKQIIEKKNHEKRRRLLEDYKKITDNSSIVSKADIDGYITYVNDEFCRISGYSYNELIGKRHGIISSPDEPKELFEELWETIKERKETWQGIIKNRTKDGRFYYVKTTIEPILNEFNEIEEFIASRVIIDDIIHPKKQLYDFIKPMKESVVVLIKIEDFKYIDGYYKHKQLNKNMQKDFAIKLFDRIPKECDFFKIYLLGNGEFAVAKNSMNCMGIEDTIVKMREFQKKINREKINMGYVDYDLSISVSLAYGKDALGDAKFGIKKLLQTKQSFIIANGLLKENQDSSMLKIETFKILKKAIDSYSIVSHFQPIVNNKTRKIEKYESLVRVIDENNKVLSPSFFLDKAKDGKYYNQITSRVLTNSFQALYKTEKDISINFSALDIENERNRNRFLELLEKHKKESSRITLELLEDENVKDIQLIKDFLKCVKSYGASVAIDDFGVGYSNFQRLIEIKPDILKIDGSLIKNIDKDDFSLHMVETIVAFSKKENIETIAEFVENETIYNILCKVGVNYSQGYYFGKPQELEKIK